jgi:transcriptional regulator MraZ
LTSFHGTFEHTLDAKNRLTLPSRFRSTLAGPLFVVRGADPCLSVYPAETYDAMATAALAQLNPLSAQKREYSRLFYANALSAELDGAGRVMLAKTMLEAVGIASREVVVAGAGDCLEVWDRGRWQAYETDLAQRAPELTASLGHPA